MRVLGLIPARAGSKGIPGKNIAPVCGRPLIAYTCDAARESRRLYRTIVSTDDAAIAAVAAEHGVGAPFLRPSEIAGDGALMRDVIRHAVEWVEAQDGPIDAVALLQPTSPLRTARHIDAAIDLLTHTAASAVVSVVAVPHQFGPASLMRMDGDRLTPDQRAPSLLRQHKPVLFARNGPAVLVISRGVVDAASFYDGDVRGLEMSHADSVDIDSADDLALAEFWLTRRTGGRA